MTPETDITYFILAGGKGQRMRPLTDNCPKPLIWIGAGWRLIDFTLYNCLCSGGGDVHVLTQYRTDMIEKYLQDTWRSMFEMRGRKLLVRASTNQQGGVFRGTADAIYQALRKGGRLTKYLMVLAADHVYSMDYRSMIQFHRQHGKTATIGTVECKRDQASRFGILQTKTDGFTYNFFEKPHDLKQFLPETSRPVASMGIFIFMTKKLKRYLEINQNEISHDVSADVIPHMVSAGDVWSFRFVENDGHPGYWRDVGELPAYWQCNMELLYFMGNGNLLQRIPSLKYLPVRLAAPVWITKDESFIYNSCISRTATINASRIAESVIGSNVRVERNANIWRSVILDGALIRGSVQLKNCVVAQGKDVHDQREAIELVS